MGRLVNYSPLEMLRRAHIILGHQAVPQLLRTLEVVAPEVRKRIAHDVVEQFVREGCGVCDSTADCLSV